MARNITWKEGTSVARCPLPSCKLSARHFPLRRNEGEREGLAQLSKPYQTPLTRQITVLVDISFVLPQPHFMFIHPEMMGEFVPDGFRYDLRNRQSVFLGRRFDRDLIKRYRIRHHDTDAVILSALGKRDAVIVAQKGFVFR